jgi:hypothetical protein
VRVCCLRPRRLRARRTLRVSRRSAVRAASLRCSRARVFWVRRFLTLTARPGAKKTVSSGSTATRALVSFRSMPTGAAPTGSGASRVTVTRPRSFPSRSMTVTQSISLAFSSGAWNASGTVYRRRVRPPTVQRESVPSARKKGAHGFSCLRSRRLARACRPERLPTRTLRSPPGAGDGPDGRERLPIVTLRSRDGHPAVEPALDRVVGSPL